MRIKFPLLFFLLFSLFSFLSPQARMLLPQAPASIDDLSSRAEVIFKGTCQGKRQESIAHPVTGKQIPLAVYSFKVEEGIKGDLKPGAVYEVKEIGVKTRQEAQDVHVLFAQTPVFESGKTYLLFLGAPNAFGVPPLVGGEYGKYSVTKEGVLKNASGVPGSESKQTAKGGEAGGPSISSGHGKKVLSKEGSYENFVGKVKESLKR